MTIAKLIEILKPYAINDACVEVGVWDGDDQISRPQDIDHIRILMDTDGGVMRVVLEP